MTSVLEALTASEVEWPEVAAFRQLAASDELRAVWLLSVSLGVQPEDVSRLLEEVWPKGNHGQDTEGLLEWPFVQKTSSGLEIAGEIGRQLATQFRDEDPDGFIRAHKALAAYEASHEDPDAFESWFSRGRLAYFLAAVDSTKSVHEFGIVFEDAPTLGRSASRNWLTSLVLDQSYLLAAHERELEFFRGFRAYSSGHRTPALRSFEKVIESGDQDLFQAIALHLTGVMVRRKNPQLSREYLEASVDLSERLALHDNTIMARHSLVWTIVDSVRDGSGGERSAAIDEACALADATLERVEQSEDPGLYAWVARTAGALSWSRAMAGHGDVSELAERAEGLLRSSFEAGVNIHDFSTSLLALNELAIMYRDQGQLGRGLETLTEAIDFAEQWVLEPSPVRRLRQSAGSLRKTVDDPELQDRLSLITRRIDRLLRQFGVFKA